MKLAVFILPIIRLHYTTAQQAPAVDPAAFDPISYISMTMAELPNATLPSGQYYISVADHGTDFDKHLVFQEKENRWKKGFFNLLHRGAMYTFMGLLFVLGFGWSYMGYVGAMKAIVLITGLTGLAIVPIGLLKYNDRLILSSERQPWTISYDNIPLQGAFVLGRSIRVNKKSESDILHAKLTSNYNRRFKTPFDNVPKYMIAKIDPNPMAFASEGGFIVFLQFLQNDSSESQWLYAMPQIGKGSTITTSPTLFTAWKFTPV